MEPFVLQSPSFFSVTEWENLFPGLIVGMTTKNGGFSQHEFTSLNMGFHVGDDSETVLKNRKLLAKTLSFPINSWVSAEQTHEVSIQRVTAQDKGKGAISYADSFLGTDGFYTNEPGILLTLCFADCVPLFFMAPKKGMIGAAHAGWKGTVHEIAKHMVEKWGQEGIDPKEIFALIGPSICGKCYIVDERVITFVRNTLDDVEKKPYNLIKEGQYSLDLREMNKLIMLKSGIPEENITMTHLCTSCDSDLFFSHRSDLGKTGRMVSFIGRKEDSMKK
ncbi:MAG: peptidoglycan editing factor PgeF [Bacillota bacterium]|nr:peptidoglycan editing factor PgeF [Bacillota bacterium]MDP4168965.1 peptidoglycan editing factor PgeF [Bacillota bacterium]